MTYLPRSGGFPEQPPRDQLGVEPEPPRRGQSSLDIPKIKFLSWLGLESILWSIVIGHLVKWAANWQYFITWQVRYIVGYGSTNFTVVYWKDFWDRLPVHVQNGLPAEVAVLCGLTLAILTAVPLIALSGRRPWRAVLSVLTAVADGTLVALLAAWKLAGWHVHWFAGQTVPEWWVPTRHDIRDVGISFAATIVTLMIFSKPRHAADDKVPVRVYLTSLPKALAAAAVPIAAVAVLAWRVPWLLRHGWQIPAHYGALASEINGWIAAGTWITVAMGIAGGLAAKPHIRRVADDVQWFIAERSASKIADTSGLNKLRTHVIGTPAHRRRVHWLLDHDVKLPKRNPWLVRGLIATGFIVMTFAAAGAWLTLWGPAAPH